MCLCLSFDVSESLLHLYHLKRAPMLKLLVSLLHVVAGEGP